VQNGKKQKNTKKVWWIKKEHLTLQLQRKIIIIITLMNANINPNIDVDKLKVLIVDDVPLNILLVRKMLGQYTFKVETAANGQQALDLISKEAPDLMLLDLMMPGIDGFEVIRRVRAFEKTKDMPIIILSALNSEADIVKGMELGANDFVNKPIIMERLINSVAKQINKLGEK
jgi:CheY-like chemotaxis protein